MKKIYSKLICDIVMIKDNDVLTTSAEVTDWDDLSGGASKLGL